MMPPVGSFPSAMVRFAELDHEVQQNDLLNAETGLIGRRYALKREISSNPEVGKWALEVLKGLSSRSASVESKEAPESQRPVSYAERKILGFTKIANPLQARPLSSPELMKAASLVSKFFNACERVAQNPAASSLMEKHTVARKEFKQEIAAKLRAAPNRETALPEVMAEAELTIQDLKVSEATKDYLRYKMTYVFAYEVKA